MQNKYITNLINIQGILVKKIDSYKNNTIISIETKAKHHICPSCLEKTNKIHDYRNQKIQHINIGDNRLIIILKKRRYVCPHCEKRFYEEYSFIQKYFRKSNELYNKIINETKQQKSLKTIAIDNHVSIPTVNRYIAYNCFLNNKHQIYTFPTHIGIDEFKGNYL